MTPFWAAGSGTLVVYLFANPQWPPVVQNMALDVHESFLEGSTLSWTFWALNHQKSLDNKNTKLGCIWFKQMHAKMGLMLGDNKSDGDVSPPSQP